jgi:hypothetical protein
MTSKTQKKTPVSFFRITGDTQLGFSLFTVPANYSQTMESSSFLKRYNQMRDLHNFLHKKYKDHLTRADLIQLVKNGLKKNDGYFEISKKEGISAQEEEPKLSAFEISTRKNIKLEGQLKILTDLLELKNETEKETEPKVIKASGRGWESDESESDDDDDDEGDEKDIKITLLEQQIILLKEQNQNLLIDNMIKKESDEGWESDDDQTDDKNEEVLLENTILKQKLIDVHVLLKKSKEINTLIINVINEQTQKSVVEEVKVEEEETLEVEQIEEKQVEKEQIENNKNITIGGVILLSTDEPLCNTLNCLGCKYIDYDYCKWCHCNIDNGNIPYIKNTDESVPYGRSQEKEKVEKEQIEEEQIEENQDPIKLINRLDQMEIILNRKDGYLYHPNTKEKLGFYQPWEDAEIPEDFKNDDIIQDPDTNDDLIEYVIENNSHDEILNGRYIGYYYDKDLDQIRSCDNRDVEEIWT